jgi:hypothetical protein
MGMIYIEVKGSFRKKGHVAFSAMRHGHARCVTDAIAFLTELLPDAIRHDHELHDDGHTPDGPFGRDDDEPT